MPTLGLSIDTASRWDPCYQLGPSRQGQPALTGQPWPRTTLTSAGAQSLGLPVAPRRSRAWQQTGGLTQLEGTSVVTVRHMASNSPRSRQVPVDSSPRHMRLEL